MHPLHRTWRVRGIPAKSDEAWLLGILQSHEDLRLDQENRCLLQAFQKNASLRVLCTCPDLLHTLQNHTELLQTFQAHPYLLQTLHDYPDLLQVLKIPSGLEVLGTQPYLFQVLQDHMDLLQVLQNPPDIRILETNPDVLRLLQQHSDLLEVLRQYPHVLPTLQTNPHLLKIANGTITNNNNSNGAEIYTLATDIDDCKIATVRFQCLPEKLAALKRGKSLAIETSYDDTHPLKRKRGVEITIDDNFEGLTILHSPSPQDHKIDILALSGLGSHPFGSFKNKDDGYMWLCDSLPRDLPGARIMIYGCDSTLQNSRNFAGLFSYGSSLKPFLTKLLHSPAPKPLLLLGHSLGGLVVKEALIQMADSAGPQLLQSIRGLLFFGVPNNGLDIESLIPMVHDQPNQPFLDSLGPNSESLGHQRQKFPEILRQSNMEMFCFYETLESPTAQKDMVTGRFSMTGPSTCLVNIPSATSCLPSKGLASNALAMQRTHSDLVKFKSQDPGYQIVLGCFEKILANLSNERVMETPTHQDPFNNTEAPVLTADERDTILHSLEFETIDIRHQTIKNAHIKTCEWFLKKPEYCAWRKSKKPGEHSGVLWIKGKPGAGKSTLMKFIVTKARSTMRNSTIISFYFNARGKDDLEKSTEGMYRSILLQLLKKAPTLQSVFDSLRLVSSDIEKHQWNIEALEMLFQEAVKQFQGSPIFCFVDALDECDETQIRRMLSFFEQTGEVANPDRVKFHVCFSSRHYPHISIKNGTELVLENEMGHDEDIRNYLDNELLIGHSAIAEEIRQEAEKKASGIFMWIVLVVGILNAEYDAGRITALRRRLRDIPESLHDLFKDILVRDAKNKRSLLLCIQWTLFAKRALTLEELFFAIHSDEEMDDPSEYIGKISEEDIKRFLLNSSKGLVEFVKSKIQAVQFIHESVRDFFLKEDGLKEIWPESDVNLQGKSHERLKQCCLNEMNSMSSRSPKMNDARSREESDESPPTGKSPFFQYAVENLFFHADAAQMFGINQLKFLEDLQLSDWIRLKKAVAKARYNGEASLLYILAVHDSANLIRICPLNQDWLVEGGQPHGPPVIAALFYKSYKAVEALLEIQSKAYPSTSPLHDLWRRYSHNLSKWKNLNRSRNFSAEKGVFHYILEHRDPILAEYVFVTGEHNVNTLEISRFLLNIATENGDLDMVQRLLENGVHINASKNALVKAAENGDLDMVQRLLENGVNINASGDALVKAAEKGHDTIVQLLLDNGAEINTPGSDGQTALVGAVGYGKDTIVQLLIERGADLEAVGRLGTTALIEAVNFGRDTTMQLLIEKGADLKAVSKSGTTALIEAARSGKDTTVQLLIEKGADLEAVNRSGATALIEAVGYGKDTTTQLLIEKGADLEATDNSGATALLEAATYSGPVVNTHNGASAVRMLLEGGANIKARDKGGRTALMLSAWYNNAETTQLLLENGADINAVDKDGNTALKIAASHDDDTITRALIEKGAKIEATNKNGTTALIMAVISGNDTVVQILIERGVNIEATNKNGETALIVAASRGRDTVARLLVELGANVEAIDKNGRSALWHYDQRKNEVMKQFLRDPASFRKRLETLDVTSQADYDFGTVTWRMHDPYFS